MILFKSEQKPRDNEYMFLINKSFGGPLVSNPMKLLYANKDKHWEVILEDYE
jgi:hypothetical protein